MIETVCGCHGDADDALQQALRESGYVTLCDGPASPWGLGRGVADLAYDLVHDETPLQYKISQHARPTAIESSPEKCGGADCHSDW